MHIIQRLRQRAGWEWYARSLQDPVPNDSFQTCIADPEQFELAGGTLELEEPAQYPNRETAHCNLSRSKPYSRPSTIDSWKTQTGAADQTISMGVEPFAADSAARVFTFSAKA
jgi:hypothetical protein